MNFKPTLAVNAEFDKIKYPVYASPKLDGIRCSIVDGKALSRTLKPIPNKVICEYLSDPIFDGLDGELIVGSPVSPTVYNETVSKVMSHDKGRDNVAYYVFDLHNHSGDFTTRNLAVRKFNDPKGKLPIIHLEQKWIATEDEMIGYEAHCVGVGYEGIILRSPDAPYKFGRSTVKEGYLLKAKRFLDSEAEIIGFEEEQFNGNSAETNELGRTKRSTAKAGLSGKGTLGAFQVRDVVSGVVFSIGTGLTAEQRFNFWKYRDRFLGDIIKYKFFPVGVKVAPRHPVFLGMRHFEDMSII